MDFVHRLINDLQESGCDDLNAILQRMTPDDAEEAASYFTNYQLQDPVDIEITHLFVAMWQQRAAGADVLDLDALADQFMPVAE